jgi:excinuclease ABC subunit B
LFRLISNFQPKGDQPQAIEKLVRGLKKGLKHQVLLGVTGSGKTFTMANVIAQINKPTLVVSHNKTLAAQLYTEFKNFFPTNAVEYFVSYYDYYQPEAYIPQTDTYIEKDASINDEIDRLRLKATSSLLERKDVIIVASVSCIYGLGTPKDYREMLVCLKRRQKIEREEILRQLVWIQYERNDLEPKRGTFRVRGDIIEIFPAYEERSYRLELFDQEIERISLIDPLTGSVLEDREKVFIYPAKHFITPASRLERALASIEAELEERLAYFKARGKLLEAQRLEARTRYDLEIIRETGYCHGIENYSRHLSGRAPGERPSCLLDYFPPDYLMILDESHALIPQLQAMYRGDKSRKDSLVLHGFRLPSAYDNRPLKFEEFKKLMPQVIYTSATPGEWELARNQQLVEQIIRPTGLVDPAIKIKPVKGQIEDLKKEIERKAAQKERVLVTTLTKKSAEDLADFFTEQDLNVKYLHSDIETLERVEILRSLRKGDFDCLVGINLLREGLDLPEVSLVAILDADQEGFLRSEMALIQTAGRAARNINGEVILYADKITPAMRRALSEMERRRKIQLEYNQRHHIVPQTIKKSLQEVMERREKTRKTIVAELDRYLQSFLKVKNKKKGIKKLKEEMVKAAAELNFEKAALLRDYIFELEGKS